MITLKELNPHDYDLTDEQAQNLNELLDKMNKVRAAYGKILNVSSGFRSMEHHIQIYKDKAKKAGVAFDQSTVPLKSKHLYAQAADLIPQDLKDFKQWCKNNDDLLRDIGIWMEDFNSTPTWVHMQTVKYGSFVDGGSLYFKP